MFLLCHPFWLHYWTRMHIPNHSLEGWFRRHFLNWYCFPGTRLPGLLDLLQIYQSCIKMVVSLANSPSSTDTGTLTHSDAIVKLITRLRRQMHACWFYFWTDFFGSLEKNTSLSPCPFGLELKAVLFCEEAALRRLFVLLQLPSHSGSSLDFNARIKSPSVQGPPFRKRSRTAQASLSLEPEPAISAWE